MTIFPARQTRHGARIAAVLTASGLILAGCSAAEEDGGTAESGTTSGTSTAAAEPGAAQPGLSGDLPFHRLATYPVYENRPEGAALEDETVAEISTATPDGNTMIYTDAAGKRVGFVDLTDPSAPKGLGTVALETLGDEDDQPTSVAVAGGYVLVVISQTGDNYAEPKGRVEVVSIADRKSVHSIDLGGQPDSIAVAPDGSFAAIAMENERDEEFTPPGKEEGDLPQPPTGFVQVIDLAGEAKSWTATQVDIPADTAKEAGLDTPEDLEPEYVSVNAQGQIAVTLQENNGIAIIDGKSRKVGKVFSAGTVDLTEIDATEDGELALTDSQQAVPREPDAIAWVDDGHVAVANEGDWKGGSRGWTVFDAASGQVTWDSGKQLEHLAARLGLQNESRAASKGTEPEGLAVAELDGRKLVFVGSERSNFVAAYDVSDAAAPVLVQVLPTTNGPEGLLPLPARNLVVFSSEVDDAEAGVRSTISVYGYGAEFAARGGVPIFPSIVSADVAGLPIGWGSLGALAANPSDDSRLYAAADNAYAPAKIFTVDVSQTPAVIEEEIPITEDGKPIELDTEGLAARADGGFYLGVEGAEGPKNEIVAVAADGAVEEWIALPAEIGNNLEKQGIEGVTTQTVDGKEILWVALQRELKNDPKGLVRIGRYDVEAKEWSWFGYQLETTATEGDWIGLSEIVLDGDKLLVLERDKLNGPAAKLKAVYSVPLPAGAGTPSGETPKALEKTLEVDLLPELRATNGWTQEKTEGLTVGRDGTLYVVTDNDRVEDATGETVFLRLKR